MALYVEGEDNQENGNGEKKLPSLTEGQILELLGLTPKQHFTQPPYRFSEATLIKELEEKGIGRPSTYATILSTIKEKGFGFEPEITARIARKRLRVFEVPVSYNGRTYAEGKKIGWKDALKALWCIFRYSLFD
jgi:hypothetical protein